MNVQIHACSSSSNPYACRDPELTWTTSDAKAQPGPKKPNRIRRECPVSGCHASVMKLSQHLKQVHKLGGKWVWFGCFGYKVGIKAQVRGTCMG